MTDTVNVPRDDDSCSFSDSLLPEAMIWAGVEVQEQVDRDNANYIAGETTDWDQGMIAVAIYRAMLAAAPKAEPAGDSVDKVMGVLNYWFDGTARVRRDADMVKQLAALIDNAQTEAPKVEQEPFGYAYETIGAGWVLATCREYGATHGKPLYTHSAPASDELMDLVVRVQSFLEPMRFDRKSDDSTAAELDIAMRAAIAKHKGPQS